MGDIIEDARNDRQRFQHLTSTEGNENQVIEVNNVPVDPSETLFNPIEDDTLDDNISLTSEGKTNYFFFLPNLFSFVY